MPTWSLVLWEMNTLGRNWSQFEIVSHELCTTSCSYHADYNLEKKIILLTCSVHCCVRKRSRKSHVTDIKYASVLPMPGEGDHLIRFVKLPPLLVPDGVSHCLVLCPLALVTQLCVRVEQVCLACLRSRAWSVSWHWWLLMCFRVDCIAGSKAAHLRLTDHWSDLLGFFFSPISFKSYHNFEKERWFAFLFSNPLLVALCHFFCPFTFFSPVVLVKSPML